MSRKATTRRAPTRSRCAGSTWQEIVRNHAFNTRVVGHEYFPGVANTFAALPRERYPTLIDNVSYMMNGDGDARFAFGIDMLIAGFAAQVPQRKGKQR